MAKNAHTELVDERLPGSGDATCWLNYEPIPAVRFATKKSPAKMAGLGEVWCDDPEALARPLFLRYFILLPFLFVIGVFVLRVVFVPIVFILDVVLLF